MFKAKNIKKILIVRNDKLGDLLVSFSAFAILKKNLPNTEIHVLVSKYTAPMAELCEFIDHIIVDPASLTTKPNKVKETFKLAKQLKEQNYDAIITLFSTLPVAFASILAKIPIRIAPATKIGQIFYNHRITQHRSRSEKPEHRYNQDLAEYFLTQLNISPLQTVSPPFLAFNTNEIANLKSQFQNKHSLAADNLLIFIHPGSGGSARNLTAQQFILLASYLGSKKNITIVISHGPGEEQLAQQIYAEMEQDKVLYSSTEGLENFSKHLAFADLFISGSTGPLHIAGALDRPTVAFYSRRQSATSLRWQTLNSSNKRLAFSPPETSEAENMMTIDIKAAAKEINKMFL